jgi:hypothetical protein
MKGLVNGTKITHSVINNGDGLGQRKTCGLATNERLEAQVIDCKLVLPAII